MFTLTIGYVKQPLLYILNSIAMSAGNWKDLGLEIESCVLDVYTPVVRPILLQLCYSTVVEEGNVTKCQSQDGQPAAPKQLPLLRK
jgi:hypothetical protein